MFTQGHSSNHERVIIEKDWQLISLFNNIRDLEIMLNV